MLHCPAILANDTWPSWLSAYLLFWTSVPFLPHRCSSLSAAMIKQLSCTTFSRWKSFRSGLVQKLPYLTWHSSALLFPMFLGTFCIMNVGTLFFMSEYMLGLPQQFLLQVPVNYDSSKLRYSNRSSTMDTTQILLQRAASVIFFLVNHHIWAKSKIQSIHTYS